MRRRRSLFGSHVWDTMLSFQTSPADTYIKRGVCVNAVCCPCDLQQLLNQWVADHEWASEHYWMGSVEVVVLLKISAGCQEWGLRWRTAGHQDVSHESLWPAYLIINTYNTAVSVYWGMTSFYHPSNKYCLMCRAWHTALNLTQAVGDISLYITSTRI